MESLPTELLCQLMERFDAETLKIGRLVSSRWNQVAEHRLKRDFQISLYNGCRLNAFMKAFDNTPELQNPLKITYFHFSGTLLLRKSSLKLLEKFCISFGHLVTGLELHGQFNIQFFRENGDTSNPELVFLKCTNLFLCHCQNIEELKLAPRKNFISQRLENLPMFAKLHSISMKYNFRKFESYSNRYCILSQIAANAPMLSNVTVSFGYANVIAKMISQLSRINPKITLRLLNLRIISMEDSNALQEMTTSPSPIRITELDLRILDDENENSEMPNRLTKWLSTLTECLKSLDIRCAGAEIAISLPALPELEFLGVALAKISPLPFRNFQLPYIRRIVTYHAIDFDVTPFIGSVFPLVESAELSLRNKDQIEYWPQIIPNVSKLELYVTKEMLSGIFRFTKVCQLKVCLHIGDVSEYVNYHSNWKQLTAGVKEISDDVICTIPLDNICATNCQDENTFRELTRLTHLEFVDSLVYNRDCWKSVIYATRTGQLHRLQKLVFGFEHEYATAYCELLEMYHDAVEINVDHDSDYEYDDDDFDNCHWRQ